MSKTELVKHPIRAGDEFRGLYGPAVVWTRGEEVVRAEGLAVVLGPNGWDPHIVLREAESVIEVNGQEVQVGKQLSIEWSSVSEPEWTRLTGHEKLEDWFEMVQQGILEEYA